MSRRIERPASVTMTGDPRYGLRPHIIRWTDRIGLPHHVEVSEVLDQFMVAKPWWERPLTQQQEGLRYWRMLIPPAGVIYLGEDLDEPTGSPKRWQVTRIED